MMTIDCEGVEADRGRGERRGGGVEAQLSSHKTRPLNAPSHPSLYQTLVAVIKWEDAERDRERENERIPALSLLR